MLAKKSVDSTAREISLYINERKRVANLFVGREIKLLKQLTRTPNNIELQHHLSNITELYFPHGFSNTIADINGLPLLTTGKEMIGNMCRQDIKQFANKIDQNKIYVHPSPTTSKQHFDVMATFNTSHDEHTVFFVSFFLDDVYRLLNHGNVNGHHLFLIKQNKAIIEANTTNAIKNFTDEGHTFTETPSAKQGENRIILPDTIKNIIFSKQAIKGTKWILVDVIEPDLLFNYKTKLLKQATIILLIFIMLILIAFWMVKKIGLITGDCKMMLRDIELERQRISMDLHDQVLADISHIRRECTTFCGKLNHIDANTLSRSEAEINNKTLEMQCSLEDVTNDIRDIIEDLHPQSINILGLGETVRSWCNTINQQTSELTIRFNMNNWDDGKLSQVAHLHLFRIIKEVVHNVIKHAHANNCDVELSMKANRLLLHVIDDGVGFSDKPTEFNHGLTNITARSRIIHAKSSWSQSETSAGTHFLLTMQLEK